MTLVNLILLTVLYYLLLWYLQRKRKKAFQVAALEVIGPTKSIDIPSIDKEAIFGTSTTFQGNGTIAIQQKDTSIKVREQMERANLFETTVNKDNTTSIEDPKLLDITEDTNKELPKANTDINVQEEIISDLNTREELNLIATELGYYEDQKKTALNEEMGLEQMMEVFDSLEGLYDQEVQEIIGNNIKNPL